LVYSPHGYLFLGKRNGVFRSTDYGQSWAPSDTGTESTTCNALALAPNGYLYKAADHGRVGRTTDNGLTWKNYFLGPDVIVNAIAINPSGWVFAGTSNEGVFMSTDSGMSWTKRSGGIEYVTVDGIVSIGQTALFAWEGKRGYRSLDFGTTWERVSPSAVDSSVQRILVQSNDLYWIGAATTVYRSSDEGMNWSMFSPGIMQVTCTDLAVHPSGALLASTREALYRSSNGGVTWDSVFGGKAAFSIGPFGELTAGIWGEASRSTDVGDLWSPTGLGNLRIPCSVLSMVELDSGELYLGFEGGRQGGLERTTNSGATWKGVYIGDVGWNSSIYSLAATPTGHVYASTLVDIVHLSNGVTVSRDTLGSTRSSFVRAGVNGYVYARTSVGLFVLPGPEQSWSYAGLGEPIWCLAVDRSGDVYAGTANGVSRFSNNVWTSLNNAGLGPSGVTALAVDSSGHLLAATNNDGFYQTTILTAVPKNPAVTTPSDYMLGQNYPNPFNPATTIRYGLPQKSHVILTAFNTLGQLVATLVDGDEEAGYHEIRFDASGLASGVYFYKVVAGNFVQTRKLLLLR
jgi:photosystem II stability/assembly factor-like uncharacterized protein